MQALAVVLCPDLIIYALRLIASEDVQRFPLRRVLHSHAGLQTSLFGQFAQLHPLLAVGPVQGIYIPVGHAVALTSRHKYPIRSVAGRKVVKRLWGRIPFVRRRRRGCQGSCSRPMLPASHLGYLQSVPIQLVPYRPLSLQQCDSVPSKFRRKG